MHKNFKACGLLLLSFALILIPQSLPAQAADPNAGAEALVRQTFADAPEMIQVAECESGIKQFRADGSLLVGGPSGQYVGIFPIDQTIHKTAAAGLGDDLATIAGNVAYARHLYDLSSSAPWRGCLPAASASSAPVSAGAITNNLDFGQVSPQILLLQQILNHAGFVLAASGPGAVGAETTFFGSLTRTAVMKFQCEKGIVCSGNAGTTGYGRVGPRTRTALNQLAS